MNKELIKTYKAEFDYWLNGGNVRAYYKKDDEPSWFTDKECIDCDNNDNFSHILQNSLGPDDVLIVIDDKYVEFRKALAEGKTVQEQDYFNKQWRDMKTDNFHGASETLYEGAYRIKPEEPKFKVGDWIINKTSKQRIIKKVTSVYSDSVTVGNSTVGINVMSIEDLELWQPQPDEYFWYHNDLVKIHETQTNAGLLLLSARGCTYYPAEKNFVDFCEPFLGQLPSSLAK